MGSEGWPPGFEDYDDGPTLLGTAIAMTIVALVFVGLRLWARRVKEVTLGWDDWLIFASLPFLFAMLALDVLAVGRGGVGRHMDVNNAVDPGRYGRAMMYLFIIEPIYATLITLVKSSILSLYYRTLQTPFIRTSCYILWTTAVGWWVAVVLVSFFQCRPLNKIWTPTMTEGTCIDINQYFLGNSIANIIIDVLILTLPVLAVSKLRMKPLPKVGIIGIFLLGSFVIVTSIIRLQKVIDLGIGGSDYTILVEQCWIWTHVESATAIVCACLPTLRPLAVKLLGSRMSSRPEESGLSTIKTIGGGTARGVFSKRPEEEESRLWTRVYSQEGCASLRGKAAPSDVSTDMPLDDIDINDAARRDAVS